MIYESLFHFETLLHYELLKACYQKEKMGMDRPHTPEAYHQHHETSPQMEPARNKKKGKAEKHLAQGP